MKVRMNNDNWLDGIVIHIGSNDIILEISEVKDLTLWNAVVKTFATNLQHCN